MRGNVAGLLGKLAHVGQVANLRPIVNRPTAGPAKLFRRSGQTGCHRVHFKVTSDSFKFGLIPNQSIVAFILPERTPGLSEYTISFPSRKSLERLSHFGNRDARRDEEVNVVGHHDIVVQLVDAFISIANRLDDHFGYLRLAQVERPAARAVQEAVHRDECRS